MYDKFSPGSRKKSRAAGEVFNYFSLHGINLGYESDYQGAPINLYIIANGKYEADSFNIQYGNWFNKKQIEKLGNDKMAIRIFSLRKASIILLICMHIFRKARWMRI